MCGIFGISTTVDPEQSYEKIIHDIQQFISLREKSGAGTVGISFNLDEKIVIYAINEKPLKAVNKIDYLKFLESNIKNQINDTLQLIGQTRLVTNGSKFSYSNNQPLQSENIVGVHNGIFTNLQSYSENKTENLESYNIKSDSLNFLSKFLNWQMTKIFLICMKTI